jgi:diaminopimelate epimerase
MGDGTRLRLSKHHGSGNDFLVMLDPDGERSLSGPEVRALCDRHRGIGADGLVRVRLVPGTGALDMELRNADGGEAEMSGNGIRCVVQAAVDAGLVEPGEVEVRTGAGVRTVHYRLGEHPGLGYAAVDMGPVVLGDEMPVSGVPGARAARRVDVGNPHVVILGSPVDPVEVARSGARLERAVEGGANVEFVWSGPAEGELTMRVWERGVGPTLACGTGACAAAAAVHAWGEVGHRVRVHNPGGPLEVTLRDGSVELAGPTQRIADVIVDASVLASLAERSMTSDASDAGVAWEVSARP